MSFSQDLIAAMQALLPARVEVKAAQTEAEIAAEDAAVEAITSTIPQLIVDAHLSGKDWVQVCLVHDHVQPQQCSFSYPSVTARLAASEAQPEWLDRIGKRVWAHCMANDLQPKLGKFQRHYRNTRDRLSDTAGWLTSGLFIRWPRPYITKLLGENLPERQGASLADKPAKPLRGEYRVLVPAQVTCTGANGTWVRLRDLSIAFGTAPVSLWQLFCQRASASTAGRQADEKAFCFASPDGKGGYSAQPLLDGSTRAITPVDPLAAELMVPASFSADVFSGLGELETAAFRVLDFRGSRCVRNGGDASEARAFDDLVAALERLVNATPFAVLEMFLNHLAANTDRPVKVGLERNWGQHGRTQISFGLRSGMLSSISLTLRHEYHDAVKVQYRSYSPHYH